MCPLFAERLPVPARIHLALSSALEYPGESRRRERERRARGWKGSVRTRRRRATLETILGVDLGNGMCISL